MKKELVALALILLAFSTGMILTAATSGCDAHNDGTAQARNGITRPALDAPKSN